MCGRGEGGAARIVFSARLPVLSGQRGVPLNPGPSVFLPPSSFVSCPLKKVHSDTQNDVVYAPCPVHIRTDVKENVV